MVGVLADSQGDLAAFDAAFELLRAKGARRFLFVGGRYADFDAWIRLRKDRLRGSRTYANTDFLADVSSFLSGEEVAARGPAFVAEDPANEASAADFERIRKAFVRTPERESLQYRDGDVERKVVDLIGDALCCVVHDRNDLTKDDLLNATVFFHGKEPEPKVVQIGPRFFVTPGRLSGGARQTCGLVEVVNRQLQFTAFGLDGAVVVPPTPLVAIAGKTKLSVK